MKSFRGGGFGRRSRGSGGFYGNFRGQAFNPGSAFRPHPGPQGPQVYRDAAGFFILLLKDGVIYRVPVNFGGQAPNPNQGPQPGQVKSFQKDPHEVLGIPKTASQEEISRAYRTLAKVHHPDKAVNMTPEVQAIADQKMKEINAAYDQLKVNK